MKTHSLIFLTIFLLPFSLFAQFNQWEPESGIPVRLAEEIEYEGGKDSNDEGFTLFAWTEYHIDSRKVLTMLVDADGIHQWEYPQVICDLPFRQHAPAVLALADNQWLISWIDFRDDQQNGGYNYIYAQKINSSGQRLFQVEGVAISGEINRMLYTPVMVKNSSGGAIISWIDDIDTGYTIFAQSIDNSGTHLWDTGGVIIAGAPNNQSYYPYSKYRIISDNDGGAVVAMVEHLTNSGECVTMQRIDADGNPLWTDFIHERFVVSGYNDDINDLEISSDNSDGVFVIWSDYYHPQEDGQIIAQHIDLDGTILWSQEGEDISQMENSLCRRPVICATGENEAVIVFEREEIGVNQRNLYMQKFSGDESVNLEWNNGQSLLLYDSQQDEEARFQNIVSDDNGGVFATWISNRFIENNIRGVIHAQHINSDGSLSLTQPLELQSDESGYRSYITATAENEALFSWFSFVEEGTGVSAQIMDNSGNIHLEPGGTTICSGIDGIAGGHKVLKSGEFTYVAWLDSRSHRGLGFTLPYIQKIDEEGNFHFPENGICLAPGYIEEGLMHGGDVDSLRICTDNNGGLYAAWSTYNETYLKKVVIQQMDENGNLLWDNTGLMLGQDEFIDYGTCELIPLPDGDVILFYSWLNENWYQELSCLRFNQERETVWPEALDFDVEEEETDNYFLGVQFVNENEIALAFSSDFGSAESEIHVRKFSVDGVELWENPPVFQSESPYAFKVDPFVSILNNNILVTWEERVRNDPESSLRASLISPDGEFLWEDEYLVLINSEYGFNSIEVGTISDHSNSFWVSHTARSVANDNDIFVQRFDYNGQPLINPPYGVRVNNPDYPTDVNDLLVLSDNSIFVVWEEEIGNDDKNISFTHVDEDGNIVDPVLPYPEFGATLNDAFMRQYNASIAPSGDSGFIAFWLDTRNTGLEFSRAIYMQKVDDGFTALAQPTRVENPQEFEITNTWPNPFNPSINISYQLAERSQVKIAVYDMLGREVAVLVNSQLNSGLHLTHWDGSNSSSLAVSSGTYFIIMETPGVEQVRKVTLIK